jgi:hypothetical protein
MGNCKDCASWDRWRARWDGAGECLMARDVGPVERVDAVDLACVVMVSDDYGLDVQILTGPQFGCVQFKAKGDR